MVMPTIMLWDVTGHKQAMYGVLTYLCHRMGPKKGKYIRQKRYHSRSNPHPATVTTRILIYMFLEYKLWKDFLHKLLVWGSRVCSRGMWIFFRQANSSANIYFIQSWCHNQNDLQPNFQQNTHIFPDAQQKQGDKSWLKRGKQINRTTSLPFLSSKIIAINIYTLAK